MDFKILGPVKIIFSQGEYPGGYVANLTEQRSLRELIAVLLLYEGRSVPRARLIELLWDEAPAAGSNRLATRVAEVRRLVGRKRLPPMDKGGGYMLRLLPEDTLDLRESRRRIAAGEVAAGDGEHLRAIGVLREGLVMWREPFSEQDPADFPLTPSSTSLVHGLLEELRLARLLMLDEFAAVHDYESIIKDAGRWAASDPTYEPYWTRLVLAQRASGRIAEAIRTLTLAKGTLSRLLGDVPNPAAWQNLAEGGEGGPSAEVGWQCLGRVHPAAAQRGHTSPRSPRPLAQLPPDLPDFVGRAEPRKLISSAVAGAHSGAKIVWISGSPGIGKTSLAIHVAHELATGNRFGDGQVYLSLSGSSTTPLDAGTALHTMLRSLGVAAGDIPDGLDARVEVYRAVSAHRNVLIVVDDAADNEHVRPLLPNAPGCTVIVTSRTRPDTDHLCYVALDHLSAGEAVELIATIIGRARVEAELEAAGQLVAACDGLPLAVRVTAARLALSPNRSLRHQADLLADPFRRLDQLTAGDVGVRGVIESSFCALPEPCQQGLRRLALMGTYGHAEWALEALIDSPQSEAILSTLVDKCLITRDGTDAIGQSRYHMHALIGDYALERLQEDPARDETVERFLNVWLEMTDCASSRIPCEPYFPAPPRITATHVDYHTAALAGVNPRLWLELEQPNLLKLTSLAVTEGYGRLAFALAQRISPYLHLQGQHRESAKLWKTISLGAEQHSCSEIAAVARLRWATVIAADQWDFAHALPILGNCVQSLRAADGAGQYHHELARALALRARCLFAEQADGEAAEEARRGYQIARTIGDRHAEFMCLGVLGLIAGRRGRHERSIRMCARAHRLTAELNNRAYESMALLTLVKAHMLANRHEEVIRLCAQGVELNRQSDNPLGSAFFWARQAEAYQALGQHTRAIGGLKESLEIFETRCAARQVAPCRLSLATILKAIGRFDEAAAERRRAHHVARSIGLPLNEVAAIHEDEAWTNGGAA